MLNLIVLAIEIIVLVFLVKFLWNVVNAILESIVHFLSCLFAGDPGNGTSNHELDNALSRWAAEKSGESTEINWDLLRESEDK